MKLTANIQPMRTARNIARKTGLLNALEKRIAHPTALWARSIFSLHDIDDLISLDVPWWTLRSIRMVDTWLRDRGSAEVFEWGSGASTVWLAKRSGSVRYVEHHAGWNEVVKDHVAEYGHVTGTLAEPVEVEAKPYYQSKAIGLSKHSFEQYVRTIENIERPLDAIVIDGRCRVRCFENAIDRVADDGVIIFDNSNRRAYRKAIKASGMATIRTRGLTPCLPYSAETTLLFRDSDSRADFIDHIEGLDGLALRHETNGITMNGVPRRKAVTSSASRAETAAVAMS